MPEHDILVIGGGFAGMRAAIAAKEAGADVALLSNVHPLRSQSSGAHSGINAALDAGRDTTRRRNRARRLASHPPPVSAQAPDGDLAGREQYQAVVAAVQALPAIYREPFVLRHLNGWSYRRIADVMGMPVDSVETRLVRARRFLRAALKDEVF